MWAAFVFPLVKKEKPVAAGNAASFKHLAARTDVRIAAVIIARRPTPVARRRRRQSAVIRIVVTRNVATGCVVPKVT